MLFGAHVSVAGGFVNGLDYAASIGAECIQFFAKSPRQWRASSAHPDALADFATWQAGERRVPAFTHTAYLLNLSSIDDELRAKTTAALADELIRGAQLGVDGVVTHIGNDPRLDQQAAAQRAAETVIEAYRLAGEAGATARLLLENTAGSGTTYGGSLGEIGAVIDLCEMPVSQLGFCFDTCHAFAYGMPVDSADGWSEVVSEMQATVGVDRLGLIHCNDCMFERGSKRDRHAWIGDGHIGIEGFAAMVCQPALAGVRVVTEMPGEAPEKDVVNLERLRELRSGCA